MFDKLKARLDALIDGFETIQGIYEENLSFFHPAESSLISSSIFDFWTGLDEAKENLEKIRASEADDGLGFAQYIIPALLIATFGAAVYAADKSLNHHLDIQEKKLDQAYELAKLGPERSALYQANIAKSPDLTITEMLSQIKPAITHKNYKDFLLNVWDKPVIAERDKIETVDIEDIAVGDYQTL